MRLFVQRARYRNPAFVLTPQNAAGVAEICGGWKDPPRHRAAAARVGLSVEEIAARLDDPLRLLTTGSRTASPRQRTLRGRWTGATTCSPSASTCCSGACPRSPGAGRWRRPRSSGAATASSEKVLDLLSGLVDKSLVLAEAAGDGAVRYRLLEPVRQYARERSEEERRGEGATPARRSCLPFVEEAREACEGRAGSVGRTSCKAEANVQAALGWAVEAEPRRRCGWPQIMGYFRYRHGHITEGQPWLEAVSHARGSRELHPGQDARLAGQPSEESGLYERPRSCTNRGWRSTGDLRTGRAWPPRSPASARWSPWATSSARSR